MTDWLEAVEQRWTVSPWVTITVAERDQLVRIARGVRELARIWQRSGNQTERAMGRVLNEQFFSRDGP